MLFDDGKTKEEGTKSKRAGAHEIIPNKLYQRGQFLTWPHRQKRAMLDRFGITMVVNLWCKIDPDLSPDEIDRIYLNWHCSPSAKPPNSELLIDFIVQAIKGGHRVLVHCEAGKGRSVWLVTRVLAQYMDMDRSDALEKVENILKHDLTATLLKDLQ